MAMAAAGKAPGICQICDKDPSKYMCPRCGVPYCSLACYTDEKHGQCSESFYRDCVMEDIKSEEANNPESAKKMKEALQRFHEQFNLEDDSREEDEEELDSDDDEPLDKRLEGIDLNNAEEIWVHLTEEERQEFQNLAKNMDQAGGIIPEWVPWWLQPPEKCSFGKVTELSSEAENVDPDKTSSGITQKVHQYQPDIFTPIPKMIDLTKIKPNEHVAKGLLNVLAAFVWTSRHFNGDMYDAENILEISSSIISLSSFLKNDGLFKNIEHALADVPLNALQVRTLSEGGEAIQASLNRDVWIIVKGPPSEQGSSTTKQYLLAALSELYNVFKMASKAQKDKEKYKSSGKKSKPSSQKVPIAADTFSKLFPASPSALHVDVKLLNRAKRKILYLLAFANESFEDYLGTSDLK